MEYMATITSKRQFTIPSAIFKKAGLKSKQKMLVSLRDAKAGIITITPMTKIVEELAGSVKVDKKYKGLNLNQMIEKARTEYYKDFE